ncbi:hypothetical protein GCM10017044_18270 [Kordiimonas sediminis]|uniref:Isoprenylcysteine carboxylmethyltransferase family protein n=1 Tax=Kordiimonas sediminis TaxID=1735581 RepID=A0A919ASG2_9PROT|nr:isoprenylcysteine carboxylmethyltransferase family protein [Kordiimonas sediminis]GHF24027.1 hypothetical protein GCM10017044_18270 [Kordiimonas sediminis]
METIGWPNWTILIFGAVMIGGFVWRTEQMRRSSGINPYRLKADDSPMGEIGKWYKRVTLLVMLYAVARCFWDIDIHTGPFAAFYLPAVQWAGVVVTSFGIVWSLAAQAQMSDSWRIGIPDDEPGALVDRGLFSISRNPFFLGSVIFNLGMFLMLPSWFMLMMLTLGWVAVNIQVRLEEEFLTRSIGDDYLVYKEKVRRWV